MKTQKSTRELERELDEAGTIGEDALDYCQECGVVERSKHVVEGSKHYELV